MYMILNTETGEANIRASKNNTKDNEYWNVAREVKSNPDVLLYSNSNKNSNYDFVTEFVDDFNTLDFLDNSCVTYKII